MSSEEHEFRRGELIDSFKEIWQDTQLAALEEASAENQPYDWIFQTFVTYCIVLTLSFALAAIVYFF